MFTSSIPKFGTRPSGFVGSVRPISANGTKIQLSDGTDCLDGVAGNWNVPLGYGHQGVADAVHQALMEASYLPDVDGGHTWLDRADKMLLEVAGPGRFTRVMHSTSGSASLEAVIKVAREYHALRGERRRNIVVSLQGSNHGTTLGAMSLSAQNLGQADLGVDMRAVRHLDQRRPQELKQLLELEGDRIAAFVLEPVQGAGTRVLEEEFLNTVLEGRAEYGYLVAADEVATGFGRTGPMFASQRWSQNVDLLVTAKGLTNGTQAASAVLLSPKVTRVINEADFLLRHKETQAGTPASCAAIMATISAFHDEDVLGQAAAVAYQLDERLHEITSVVPGTGLTGTGCFRSLTLPGMNAAGVRHLVERCLYGGAVVHPGPNCIQLAPALVYGREDLDRLMDRVHHAVVEMTGSHRVVAA
ncbi:Putrescine aminotransferase [Actinomyces bovis]|uniref:Putrescine aminotransferase n=1 Tax=Actinomyces bovis TaxID=1658 RepID=A0ABY1VQN3_9ACTO|nr:aminotransferase class III-fold pyridoxal phosphate-dependent enzyme [Actinomyces bovis]SPT54431.1 Putrescine aminotransferase [Actinomyces bovis]VEG55976.1 Putrescine aminotransferase [Actinomyces israelii]